MDSQLTKEDYNKIPVYYCSHCLSLAVKGIPSSTDFDYCTNCGSVDIKQCSIEEWEELYKKAHKGQTFLNSSF